MFTNESKDFIVLKESNSTCGCKRGKGFLKFFLVFLCFVLTGLGSSLVTIYLIRNELKNNYTKKSELMNIMNSFKNDTDEFKQNSTRKIEIIEQNFNMKIEDISHNLNNYTLKSELEQQLLNYANKSELNKYTPLDKLDDYINRTELKDNYYDKNETLSSFNQSINDYVYNNHITNNTHLIEISHPNGSYYWSDEDISPQELFGGEWEKIEDRFIFAAGNKNVGDLGGEEEHYLTIEELPSHSHNITQSIQHITDGGYEKEKNISEEGGEVNLLGEQTDSTGGNKKHNNMPPYIVSNCWKRIS